MVVDQFMSLIELQFLQFLKMIFNLTLFDFELFLIKNTALQREQKIVYSELNIDRFS